MKRINKPFNILKKALLIAVMATGISSCTITDDLNDPNESPINFANARVIGSTKANDKATTWDGAEEVGIIAMKTEGEISATAFTANFINNLKLTNGTNAAGTNNTWTPEETLLWPVPEIDRITFFAYHPYVASTASLGMPVVRDAGISIEHIVKTNPSEQTDLLWDWVIDAHRRDMDGNGSGGDNQKSVPFAFKHALTKISFSASTNLYPNVISITITNLTVTANSRNVLTTTGDVLTWTHSAATTPVTVPVVTSGDGVFTINTSGAITGFTPELHELLMVPQDHTGGGNKINISYIIKYPAGAMVEQTEEYILTGRWNQNAHIKYNINITRAGIVFEPLPIAWGVETTEEL